MATNQFGQIIGEKVPNWQPRQVPSQNKLIGRYCTLEQFDINKHTKDLFEAFTLNDQGEMFTYVPYGPFAKYEEFLEWIKEECLNKIYYIVIDHKNNPQGTASFLNLNPENGSIEVGAIVYSKQLQKTKAATEAMYLMMYEIFENLKYRRYEWKCNALNQPSRKAAKRLGFKFEGIFRQHWVVKGHNRDTAWYSILDSEWPTIKNKLERWLDPTNFDENNQQITKLNHIQ